MFTVIWYNVHHDPYMLILCDMKYIRFRIPHIKLTIKHVTHIYIYYHHTNIMYYTSAYESWQWTSQCVDLVHFKTWPPSRFLRLILGFQALWSAWLREGWLSCASGKVVPGYWMSAWLTSCKFGDAGGGDCSFSSTGTSEVKRWWTWHKKCLDYECWIAKHWTNKASGQPHQNNKRCACIARLCKRWKGNLLSLRAMEKPPAWFMICGCLALNLSRLLCFAFNLCVNTCKSLHSPTSY